MDNARGDVPREWYRDEGHVGYDVDGRKIVKQKWDDSIEHLIRLTDDLSYWRNVFDEKGEKELVVSKSQLELFRRLRTSIIPVKDIHSDEVQPPITNKNNIKVKQVAYIFRLALVFLRFAWKSDQVITFKPFKCPNGVSFHRNGKLSLFFESCAVFAEKLPYNF
jgi:hypothetical protein